MKKVLLIVIIALGCNFGFSQNNLEFNTALYGNFSANITTGNQSVGTIVVPAGKVWKIEARSVVRADYNGIQTGEVSAAIGSLLVYHSPGQDHSLVPIWLPSGTYDIKVSVANNNLPYVFSYSGVEFNLVP